MKDESLSLISQRQNEEKLMSLTITQSRERCIILRRKLFSLRHVSKNFPEIVINWYAINLELPDIYKPYRNQHDRASKIPNKFMNQIEIIKTRDCQQNKYEYSQNIYD